MTTITHAVMVLEDRVRLRNLTKNLKDKMENTGFSVESDGYGNPSILYNKDDSSSLESLFIWLANNRVAFEADNKDISGGPSGLMSLIQNKGKYKNNFISCLYDGKNWNYVEK